MRLYETTLFVQINTNHICADCYLEVFFKMGVPPVLIHVRLGFSIIDHPAIVVPPAQPFDDDDDDDDGDDDDDEELRNG